MTVSFRVWPRVCRHGLGLAVHWGRFGGWWSWHVGEGLILLHMDICGIYGYPPGIRSGKEGPRGPLQKSGKSLARSGSERGFQTNEETSSDHRCVILA